MNDLAFLRAVVQDLQSASLPPLVFGGWAEELLGLRPPGPHGDVDLLLVDPDQHRLTGYLADRKEVVGKRFSHKRAFVMDGVLVELFLVKAGSSTFWDTLEYKWPDLSEIAMDGLPLAPAENLFAYRRDHETIREAGPRLV